MGNWALKIGNCAKRYKYDRAIEVLRIGSKNHKSSINSPELITHYPLPITHYPLPITHYS
ncbi:MAG: hypothetical protein HC942_01750 [Microcoleus sp. SU_5_6]|nr:hypothetical protein [Microcoleus sp. SU_5_6]